MKAIVSLNCWYEVVVRSCMIGSHTSMSGNDIFSLNFFCDIHKLQAYWQLHFFRGLSALWCKLVTPVVVSVTRPSVHFHRSFCTHMALSILYYKWASGGGVVTHSCPHFHHVAIYLERSDWKMCVVAKYCLYYPDSWRQHFHKARVSSYFQYRHHALSNKT